MYGKPYNYYTLVNLFDGVLLYQSVLIGLLVGLVLGFIDSYGYAVTGYTTCEISVLTAPVLVVLVFNLILRRKPYINEVLLASAIAIGMNLTTAITAGMYITYTILAEAPIVSRLGLIVPQWLYMSSEQLRIDTIAIYLHLTLVSAGGIALAYAFSKHFLERERLMFPLGSASAMLVSISIVKGVRGLLMILVGLIFEMMYLIFGPFTIDFTTQLQSILQGSSLALTLDVFIFLIALVIPLNASIGISLGNFIAYLVLLPILVMLRALYVPPGMGALDMPSLASPELASIVVGFIIVASLYYTAVNIRVYFHTFSRFRLKHDELIALIICLLLVFTLPIVTVVLDPQSLTIRFLPIFILLPLLHFFLALVTVRVVGEVGVASQSILPIASVVMYTMGYRGATGYVILDPYTGIPMPEFMAGSSMNVIKASKILGVNSKLVIVTLFLGILIGAPITLYYGHLLLSVYGLNSPKFPLVRWLPIVTWMAGLYTGRLDIINFHALILGIIAAIIILAIIKVSGLTQITLFSILIGLTLTPDYGILFLVASVIKYIISRISSVAHEALLLSAACALAGAGLAIIVYTIVCLVI